MNERQCILAANILNKHGGEVESRGEKRYLAETLRSTPKP